MSITSCTITGALGSTSYATGQYHKPDNSENSLWTNHPRFKTRPMCEPKTRQIKLLIIFVAKFL